MKTIKISNAMKTKNSMKCFFLSLLTLLCLVSCTKEDNPNIIPQENPGEWKEKAIVESSDNYSAKYQYSDSVVVLSENELCYLKAIEGDSDLIFDGNTPAAALPTVGKIVTCGITERTPYGIANEVISVSKSGDTYVLKTRPVTLQELFKHMEFSYTCNIEDLSGKGFYDEDGNYFEYDRPLQFNLDFPEGKIEKSLSVNGFCFLEPRFTITYDRDKNEHQAILKCRGGFNGELGIKDDRQEKEFPLIRKGEICDGVIAVGPLVLRPSLSLDLLLNCAVEGTLATSVKKEYEFSTGHVKDDYGNRFILENETEKFEEDMIRNLDLDGKGSISLEFVTDFNLGMFLKESSLDLTPEVTLECAADFDAASENLFKEMPEVNNGLSLSLNSAVSGNFIWDFFSRFHGDDYKGKEQINLTLAADKLPLFPVVDKASYNVTETAAGEGLTFHGTYSLSHPGLLSRFNTFTPSVNIYKGSELIQSIAVWTPVQYGGNNQYDFEVSGVSEDTSYVFNPCITDSEGVLYEANGYPFSSTEPAVAITDIVQLAGEYSPEGFDCDGYLFKYKYKVCVRAYIIGHDACTEWGVCGAFPFEMKDGPVTTYWGAYSDEPSTSFSFTPYAKFGDETRYYETKSKVLTCDEQPVATKAAFIPNAGSNTRYHLDSVVVNGIRIY